MSPRALSALAVVLAAALLAPAPAGAATDPSLLFVQQAGGGTLRKTGASTYRLTLRRVSPSVSSFADRPARTASSEPARRFVARWKGRFAEDPPNAALVMDGAPRGRDVAMLTLSRPAYDPATRTFSYVARALGGRPGAALRAFHARRDPVRELRFGAASLFIDDAAQLVAQQMTVNFQTAIANREYALEMASYGGWDVAFAPGTAASPAIEIINNGEGSPAQVTILPDRISFSLAPGQLVAGAASFAVTIDFVADPALMAFYLREVSPMPAAPMLYDGAGEPAVPIERKNTLIFWPGLLPQ